MNTNPIPPPLLQLINTNTSRAFYKNFETNKKFDIIPYDQLIHILSKPCQILKRRDYDFDKREEVVMVVEKVAKKKRKKRKKEEDNITFVLYRICII